MDTSPSRLHNGNTYEQIMNLRKKDTSKELGPEMRYKANQYVEKLKENKVQYTHQKSNMYTSSLINSKGELRTNLELSGKKDVNNLLTKLGF